MPAELLERGDILVCEEWSFRVWRVKADIGEVTGEFILKNKFKWGFKSPAARLTFAEVGKMKRIKEIGRANQTTIDWMDCQLLGG